MSFLTRFLCCLGLLTSMAGVSVAADSEPKIFTQKPAVAKSQSKKAKPAKPAKVAKPVSKTDPVLLSGPTANWIWGALPNTKYFLTKEFTADAKTALLIASCDNVMTVYLNGKKIAAGSEWGQPSRVDVTKQLQRGKNVLLAEVANEGGPSGFALKLAMTEADGLTRYVVTDKSWQAAEKKDAEKTTPVKTFAKMGAQPYGNVFAKADSPILAAGVRNVFQTLPGFQVELLYTVPKDTQGSWVSLTTDNKGRLLASDQGNKGLYRITPPPIGSDKATRIEKLETGLTASHGMLYAFDSLYVTVNGGPGSGLYRLRDTNGDDQFDKTEKLKAIRGGGEHGPHALRLSPDGKSIYFIAGNHTDPPENFDASRMKPNWSEDLLLPRQWDARGHARGKLAPGGWVAITDPEGKTWEMFSNGYRNPFDMDFNADGELFVYDADMEWDFGTPWYRPTRVMHTTSGAEFGWRSGTGKWPAYFPDSLPALSDIGPGSPVGVTFGYGTKFPAKYQKALYLLDWTFGTIHVVHPKAAGASYTATKEEFLSRSPLPLTDAVVGSDGALYFTVGGRGAQSELFRVTYVGDASTAPVDAKDTEFAELRSIRRRLESYHNDNSSSAKAVEFIWPNLGHSDRHIRFAARTAIEHQDVKLWQKQALTEDNAETLISAVIALARQGDKSLEPQILSALDRIDINSLTDMQKLAILRAYGLTIVRMGQPDQQTADRISQKLDPLYPAKTDDLNRELSRLLVALNSPTVITKALKLMHAESQQKPEEYGELLARNAGYGGTIAAMLANRPEIQKIHYALVLRNMRYGWTLEQRKEYFAWFGPAMQRSGGASYVGFIKNIRDEALATLSAAEKKALDSESLIVVVKAAELPKPKGPGHAWTLDEMVGLSKAGLTGRNFENGLRTYAAARCVVCHRFDGAGGATGPDLTNVAGRFSYRDLGESLVDPSKVVSDQYRASFIETIKGKIITGRVTSEANGKVIVLTDPEDGTKVVQIPKGDVESITPSKVSLMPKDLLKTLNKDELLDLLAYLMSRGNPNDVMFAK